MFLWLPIYYADLPQQSPLKIEKLIDNKSISVACVYNDQNFNFEWAQDKTPVLLDTQEASNTKNNGRVLYDESQIFQDNLFSIGENGNGENAMSERKRRSIELNGKLANIHFDQHLMSGSKKNLASYKNLWKSTTSYRNKRDIVNVSSFLPNLPLNRTIYFNCQNAEPGHCLQAKATLHNIKAKSSPITISLNFTIDLRKVGKFKYL